MTAGLGPVLLLVQGDTYPEPARISAIIWEGATTAGDTVELRRAGAGLPMLLWAGRAVDTQTYAGISFGSYGLHAPTGFTLYQRSSGRVLVYLRED